MDTQYTVLDYGEEVKVNSEWASPCDNSGGPTFF